MKLKDGRVIVDDDLQRRRILALTGETVPPDGMPVRDLKKMIDGALARARERARRPDEKRYWDMMEKALESVARFAALH